jgi:DNA-binding transcriptional LysR family regulator
LISNLTQLRHFIALAEAGSFTQAARNANRSQPAFSRSIAELENDLGVQLFDRTGHRNELTFIGRALLEHARQMTFLADDLNQCVSDHLHGRTGHFRMGLGSTPSALLTTPLLTYAAKSQSMPKITLSSGSMEQLLTALQERQLDSLVIDMRSVKPVPALQIERLAVLKAGLMVRPMHPLLRKRGRIVFSDLLHYPIASTKISDEVTRLLVEAFGSQAHPSAMVTLRCEDVSGLMDTVSHSDAIFVGVLAVARERISQGRLVELPFPTKGLESHYALVSLGRHKVSAAFEPIRQLILENMRD